MLDFDKLSLRQGRQLLIKEATFTIHRGQHIALTGANGCGKSSLFSLILGRIEADKGSFRLPKNISIAHVAQTIAQHSCSALDYTMQGDAELSKLHKRMQQAETAEQGEQLLQLHEQYQAIDGYSAAARAAKLLHGLGFQAGEEQRAVNSFSGGWRMRLNLAQALMCRSDLLLLDEPTNHLDLEAIVWLERWLMQYDGTLLLISHDRDFLDRCVQSIAHIEHQEIKLYSGNYTAFEYARAEQLAQQQAAYEKQQQNIQHIQSYIQRFRAKASKAKQAQSRLKSLERMQTISAAHIDSPFSFRFKAQQNIPNPLLSLEQAATGYDQTCLLSAVSLSILPTDRIGLLGLNGAGKTTLIKLLAGELPLFQGKRCEAQGLRIGYFAQHQIDQLHPECSAVQHLQMIDPEASEKDLRQFLGGFHFMAEQALEAIKPFSGGEKARLVLALLVYQQPNVLLLDEPTNHLDLDMRLALSMALQDFEGAMVLVSHDRHLLNMVCDRFLRVHDQKVEHFDGDLQAYEQWLIDSKRSEQKAGDSLQKKPGQVQQEQRKALQRLKTSIKKIEQTLNSQQQRYRDLDVCLADPQLYDKQQAIRLQELQKEHQALTYSIQEQENAWMQACEQLEQQEALCN